MTPAYSNEAEQAVLGCLLVDQKAWYRVEGLKTDDFYRGHHRSIFKAITELHHAREQVDVITVSEHLKRGGALEQIGGLTYLASLAHNTPSTSNAGTYARLVKERSQVRRATSILQDALESVQQDGVPAISRTLTDLLGLFKAQSSNVTTLHEAAFQVLEEIDHVQRSGRRPGIPTGLSEVDSKLGGLHKSDLVVIGARPAMGKTSILLNFAWHGNVPTGIVTAEQPRTQLAQRALSMIGRINGKKFRNATIDKDEFSAAHRAYNIIKERSIYLYDRPRPSMDDVAQQARQWKHENDIQLLCVDYIQRIDSRDGETREEKIEEVVRGLKSLARELDVPVVALSSVNRSLESRPDKRPTLGDFKGSGAIESEADVAIGLYRDEVYFEKNSNKGIAELIFVKNRHGPIGSVDVRWTEEFMVFEDL